MARILDRDLLEINLEDAERHVVDAEHEVLRQRMIVAGLGLCGGDTSRATHLLRQFEEMLCMHIADRDRLRKELSD